MILPEELKAIITKYSLTQEELYRHNDDLMLVSARGIRKIITVEKLNVAKRIYFDALGIIAVVARVQRGSVLHNDHIFYEAIGEAKPGLNTTFKFPVAVAEARANSRAVLMSVGLYEKGIIGEVELDMEVEAANIITQRKAQSELAVKGLTEKLNVIKNKKKNDESNVK